MQCPARREFVAIDSAGAPRSDVPTLVLECGHDANHGGTHRDPATGTDWYE